MLFVTAPVVELTVISPLQSLQPPGMNGPRFWSSARLHLT